MRNEKATLRTPKTAAAANSARENGYCPPPGKSRQSTSSTPPASAIATTGSQLRGTEVLRASATPASTMTSRRNATGLAASVRAASAAKRKRACACSASAIPSANGNAADRTIPAHTTANERLDQRVVGPHSCHTTTENASAASATVATASSLIPKSAASG